MSATLIHDPDVRAQLVDGRTVADYTSSNDGAARRCSGHRTDNIAGYVVRHTLDSDGKLIARPGEPDSVGVDVYAVEPTPTWGNYDKAVAAARGYRAGRSWAVIDFLYRCGHRSAG